MSSTYAPLLPDLKSCGRTAQVKVAVNHELFSLCRNHGQGMLS